MKEKKQLRRELLQKRRKQTRSDILARSKQIEEKLFSQLEFTRASVVMFYVSMADEVQTLDMIRNAPNSGKKVAVPFLGTEKDVLIPSLLENFDSELEKGPFGIMQPKTEFLREVPVGEIDLVLVPGIGFDRNGNRLGFGGGFYDRFLKSLPEETPVFGLAFTFQVVDKVPVTPHDVPVGRVISELEVMNCREV